MRFIDYVKVSDRCDIRQHPAISNKCICLFSYCGTNCVEVEYSKRHLKNMLTRYVYSDIIFTSVDGSFDINL